MRLSAILLLLGSVFLFWQVPRWADIGPDLTDATAWTGGTPTQNGVTVTHGNALKRIAVQPGQTIRITGTLSAPGYGRIQLAQWDQGVVWSLPHHQIPESGAFDRTLTPILDTVEITLYSFDDAPVRAESVVLRLVHERSVFSLGRWGLGLGWVFLAALCARSLGREGRWATSWAALLLAGALIPTAIAPGAAPAVSEHPTEHPNQRAAPAPAPVVAPARREAAAPPVPAVSQPAPRTVWTWNQGRLIQPLGHFGGYLVLGVLAFRLRGWRGLLDAGLFAVCTEVVQLWTPDRRPGVDDVVVNVLGLLVGATLTTAARQLQRRRQDD